MILVLEVLTIQSWGDRCFRVYIKADFLYYIVAESLSFDVAPPGGSFSYYPPVFVIRLTSNFFISEIAGQGAVGQPTPFLSNGGVVDAKNIGRRYYGYVDASYFSLSNNMSSFGSDVARMVLHYCHYPDPESLDGVANLVPNSVSVMG